jgi:hypothetical protein
MSLPTGRQAKHKTQNRMTQKIFGSIVDGLVKNPIQPIIVIPVKTGIQ